MNRSKSKKGHVAFKIDLEKTYDRLSWDFLKNGCFGLWFSPIIVSLIMWCTKSCSICLVWSGSKTEPFSSTRGLRQGNPLSPHLFIICMERLSLYIQQLVKDDVWEPMSISRGDPQISHMLFADDILLSAKAKEPQFEMINSTLDLFCMEPELKVNPLKSKLMFSRISELLRIYVSTSC